MGNSHQIITSSNIGLHLIGENKIPQTLIGGRSKNFTTTKISDFNFHGFYQINETHIIVVDKSLHCLHVTNVLTKSTIPFAGGCGEASFQNGESLEARFSCPTSIVGGFHSNQYYVTDTLNNAIRILTASPDHTFVHVGTLIQNSERVPSPLGIATSNSLFHIYITGNFDVAELNTLNSEFTEFSFTEMNNYKSIVNLFQYELISSISRASKDMYLLLEKNKDFSRVLVMDTLSNTVEILQCRSANEKQSDCQFDNNLHMISMSIHEDGLLYISQNNTVRSYRFKGTRIKNLN